MLHSPRVYQDRVWLLDSGRGQLVAVDPAAGRHEVVTTMPGYARGLAFLGPYAFIGLSRIRETSVFGGLPISAQRDELKCGLCAVDLRSGRQVAAATPARQSPDFSSLALASSSRRSAN